MALTSDALQPQVMGSLYTFSGRGIRDNLLGGIESKSRLGFDVSFVAGDEICVDFRDADIVTRFFAGDASRFAASTFASIKGITASVDDTYAIAWSMVRMYYAAFYAGHCLLRLLGLSCSYLDGAQLARVKLIGNAQGQSPTNAFDRGTYVVRVTPSGTGLILRATGAGSQGGSHEAFWKILCDTISEKIETLVLSSTLPQRDSQEVFAQFQRFLLSLKRSGNSSGAWLSAVRNSIQYKHEYGVWLPSKLRRADRGVLSRSAKQWQSDPISVIMTNAPGRELGDFVAACSFMISVCRDLLHRILERSIVGNSSFAHELVDYALAAASPTGEG